MKRELYRENCFKLVFLSDFYDLEKAEQIKLYLSLEDEISEKNKEEIKESVLKCLNLLENIDLKLSENISGWSLNRIGKIEKAILRFALYEIDYVEDIPSKVAINEAVNLAKKFGTEESPKFINGVLAKLA